MHLYNLIVQSPTAIIQAVVGSCSGTRLQEVVVSRGTRLELVRLDSQTGKLSTVIASDVFVSIHCLATFRITEVLYIRILADIQTEIDDVPLAVLGFQGQLAAGIGKALRLYDIGKKQLLRKVENKNFPPAIVTLNTQGFRILVGDMQESIHYAAYKPLENRLVIFADGHAGSLDHRRDNA
ncbi:hypothetical protein ACG7TL_003007 [Trametes sanguinea]